MKKEQKLVFERGWDTVSQGEEDNDGEAVLLQS